jgi:hypothetical protein
MSLSSSNSKNAETALSKVEKNSAKAVVIDYVAIARKDDTVTQDSMSDNPIYQMVIMDESPKEQRIAKLVEYLTDGLEDNSCKVDDLDKREKALVDFNSFIQVLRKQLGTEQAKEITSKTYADFQRILNDTSSDVATYESELEPLYFSIGPNFWYWDLYPEFLFGQVSQYARCDFTTYGITLRIPTRFHFLSEGALYVLNPWIISMKCVAPTIVPQ